MNGDTLQPVASTAAGVGVFHPTYCGSVATYLAMAAYGNVVIDATARYDKREKTLHRCTIAGPNGPQRLTVPLQKPSEWHTTRIADLIVSDHGDWPHLHWGALEAAYGRTPYFEYYADDLWPLLLAAPGNSLVALDMAIHRFCLAAIGIPQATHSLADQAAATPPPAAATPLPMPDLRPYYQTWAARFGFMPNLSVLDLIFNLGPEAALYLRPAAVSHLAATKR